ncbi:MAG: hypothetical protein RR587_15445, partial [Solibacillus sp.]
LAAPPRLEKVAENIAYFEEHGCFERHVILEKVGNGKKNSHMIVDGYSVFVASQELNLRHLDAMIVESLVRKEPDLVKSGQ